MSRIDDPYEGLKAAKAAMLNVFCAKVAMLGKIYSASSCRLRTLLIEQMSRDSPKTGCDKVRLAKGVWDTPALAFPAFPVINGRANTGLATLTLLS